MLWAGNQAIFPCTRNEHDAEVAPQQRICSWREQGRAAKHRTNNSPAPRTQQQRNPASGGVQQMARWCVGAANGALGNGGACKRWKLHVPERDARESGGGGMRNGGVLVCYVGVQHRMLSLCLTSQQRQSVGRKRSAA
jgi:hypothetical protein